jgi:DUF1680 family protein
MKKFSKIFTEPDFIKSILKDANPLFVIVFIIFATVCQAQTVTSLNDKLILNKNTLFTKGGFLEEKTRINLEKRLLSIDLESILAPYKNRPGAQQWIGEHVGKFLHAAVLEYQQSGNQMLKDRIDYAANELIKTQLPDGYLGTYEEKNRWTSWDVWSHKYNMIGLLAYYDLTKDVKVLSACEKMATLLSSTFGEGKKDIIASGTHVGMAPTSILEPMVKLYTITGKKEHLQFCEYLVASWEQENGPKLVSSLLEHGNVHKTANGKAYEMMSCLVGLLDLYKITGNEDYLKAIENAWNDIVTHRLYINGTASHTEHFQVDHALSPTGSYPYSTKFCGPGEGCVSVTWLQMNMRLLEIKGGQKYMQQIENTVYNAILSSQNPNNGEICYFLPLTGRKRYGEVTHGILPDICCCSSSIPRGVSLISNLVFGRLNDAPIIMLLTAAKAETYFVQKGKQIPVTLDIETEFPKIGNAKVTLKSSAKSIKNASILFNIPEWANEYTIKISDEIFEGKSGSILEVRRDWKNGDVLDISIGMPVVKVKDNNKGSNLIALKRGPQLLAVDKNISDAEGLPKWGGWNGDQLYKLSVLSDNTVSEMLLVPFADAGQSMAIYNSLFPDFELLQTIESSSLKKYVDQLSEFEKEFRSRELPDIEFFLFGMGNRTKLLYKDGVLKNAISGEIIKQWPVKRDLIIPNEYKVEIETLTDVFITIYEDENGVYIKEGRKNERVDGTNATIKLPTFVGHKYSEILKVLNHEILINIVDSKPVPNFIVYNKPWRRDAAMMAMCLEETGNLNLIKDWVLNLNEPYDRNNEGNTEPDNLGQTLYLLSLFSDENHPLVKTILEAAKEFEVKDDNGLYIKGSSDFHETPVYQTKWMKYGLRALGMDDPYSIPKIHDDYSSLFWWDYKDNYLEGTTDAYDQWNDDKYPYIGWAADNFHGKKRNPISNRLYPLTWEQEASQAKYENLDIIDEVYVTEKISAPHTWHAAEVFLYLLRQKNNKF